MNQISKSSNLSLVIALGIIVLAICCKPGRPGYVESIPFFNTAELTPEWIKTTDTKYKKIHRVAPFSFIDQDSSIVTNATFDNHIYVTNFFFTTCPSICPKMTDNMIDIQERFRSDDNVKLLSHTVTPWIDTVQQLKKYALEKKVISGKWHLVTGKQSEIYKQARVAYLIEGEMGLAKGEDDFLHDEKFVLIDRKRRIRGYYNGITDSDIKRLIQDMETLLIPHVGE